MPIVLLKTKIGKSRIKENEFKLLLSLNQCSTAIENRSNYLHQTIELHNVIKQADQ